MDKGLLFNPFLYYTLVWTLYYFYTAPCHLKFVLYPLPPSIRNHHQLAWTGAIRQRVWSQCAAFCSTSVPGSPDWQKSTAQESPLHRVPWKSLLRMLWGRYKEVLWEKEAISEKMAENNVLYLDCEACGTCLIRRWGGLPMNFRKVELIFSFDVAKSIDCHKCTKQ